MKTDKKKELAEKMDVPLQWMDCLESTDDFFEEAVSYLEDIGLVEDKSYWADCGGEDDTEMYMCVTYNVKDKDGLIRWCEEYGIEYRLVV